MQIVNTENKNNEKFLRKRTENFKFSEFEKRALRELILKMRHTMKSAEGIGLSANQVGIGKRFFVAQVPLKDESGAIIREKFYAIFNPKIVKSSKKTIVMEEGCLSIPGLYGPVERPERITLEGYDKNGRKMKIEASGLLARVFQHEMDHLDGKFFIDRVKKEDIKNILKDRPINFVFFGTPEFAQTVLKKLIEPIIDGRRGFKPTLLVCNPDKPIGRKQVLTAPPVKHTAEEHGIPVFQPEKLGQNEISRIKSVGADFAVLASYGKIIPKELIEAFPRGIIGVHPSLLPSYRGASPIQTAILDGAKISGVTLFLLDDKVDHGPIIAQRKLQFSISGFQFPKLHNELAELGGDLLVETLPEFIKNKTAPLPQDEARATYTKKFTSQDGYVSPDELARAQTKGGEVAQIIERKIRALNPEPGVWTADADGKRIKLLAAEMRNGAIKLVRIQREGGNPQQIR